MSSYHFLVNRSALSETRIENCEIPSPGSGEVLLQVDRFALTANNITYGVAGDLIGYWKFFPAADGWGRIPVWGVGTVISSNSADIKDGSRYYGYYPMSGHLLVTPGKISDKGFADHAAHRQELPPVYNQYSLMSESLGFPPGFDNHQAVYRPLFTTSFVIDDFFFDNDFFGAEQIILSSASSKTAFGTAFMLQNRPVRVIGLTSKGNKAFVEGLGLYDRILTYDEVSSLDASVTTAYIDMSGNRGLLAEVHHHFQNKLVNSCSVGITHWEAREGEDPRSLPGAKPTMFFAPSQIQKRSKEWGPELLQNRLGAAWQSFLGRVDDWVSILEFPAPDELSNVYETVLNGPEPHKAYVLRRRD